MAKKKTTKMAADKALPDSAGSVPDQIEVQVGIITYFFHKHNADEIQWDALDRLRESISLILGYAETQRKCKLAAHDRLDQAYDHFFSQNAKHIHPDSTPNDHE